LSSTTFGHQATTTKSMVAELPTKYEPMPGAWQRVRPEHVSAGERQKAFYAIDGGCGGAGRRLNLDVLRTTRELSMSVGLFPDLALGIAYAPALAAGTAFTCHGELTINVANCANHDVENG
jgi:hypothetical protein